MTRHSRTWASPLAALAIAVPFAIAGLQSAGAQERVIPDTYLAITTNMTPADVEIKADVLGWSTDAEREAVIAALQSEDPSAALSDLPSKGAVWRMNSAVGTSIKYAHREPLDDGGERITLVTDRRIAYTSFKPLVAANPATDKALEYSVVEMTVGGPNSGEGTLSLSAEVNLDAASNRVSLDRANGAPLLTNVRMAPKPYWATQN